MKARRVFNCLKNKSKFFSMDLLRVVQVTDPCSCGQGTEFSGNINGDKLGYVNSDMTSTPNGVK